MQVSKRACVLAVVSLLIATTILSGCSRGSGPASKPEEKTGETPAAKPAEGPIRIGFVSCLTGSNPEEGNRGRRGALLAIEEANKAGGHDGRTFELVVEDDRGDPKEAANVAKKFVADSSIIAAIGHLNSSCTLAAAPIYNKAKLVHISPSSSSPKISDAGPYTFRTWNSDAYTARFNVETILKRGYKKVAIIYENNDYGRGGYEVAKKTLEEAGFPPVATESYLLGEMKDFSTIITKLKNAGAEAIYAISDEVEIPLFLKQARQMNYRPFFVSSGTDNPAVIELGGQDVEGAVGNALFSRTNLTPKLKEFFDKYLERFKGEGVVGIDTFSPCSYDAAGMIIKAIKKEGPTREGVKEHLTELKDYDGALGKLSFDERGDVEIPMVNVVIKDGKLVDLVD